MLLSGQSSGKSKDWSERPEDVSDQSFYAIFLWERGREFVYIRKEVAL